MKQYVMRNHNIVEETWTLDFYIDGNFVESKDYHEEDIPSLWPEGWHRGFTDQDIAEYEKMLEGMKQVVQMMKDNKVS